MSVFHIVRELRYCSHVQFVILLSKAVVRGITDVWN